MRQPRRPVVPIMLLFVYPIAVWQALFLPAAPAPVVAKSRKPVSRPVD
jgi:hypothetical protein